MRIGRVAVVLLAMVGLTGCPQLRQAQRQLAGGNQTTACPVVAERGTGAYTRERDYLGRWSNGGVVTGFSVYEDSIVYQTRWCASHMPAYSG